MSYKAILRNKRHAVRKTTERGCLCSALFICGVTPIGLVEYSSSRMLGNRFLNVPEHGQLMTSKQADALDFATGRAKPYTRNSVSFEMSRAARRRGIVSTSWFYLRRAEQHARRRAMGKGGAA